MQRFGARWLGPLAVVIAMLAAWPAGAAAAGWTCEASALRAQVLTAPAVEPAVANRGAARLPGGRRRAAASLPALPIGVSGSALTAGTALDGPLAGPAKDQIARAHGAVADVGVASLPSLPIALPEPDFSGLDAVNTPLGRVDLRPALEALIPPRALPNLELLRVRAASAEASAQCVSGVPRFSGSSALAAVLVNGHEIGLDSATAGDDPADRLAARSTRRTSTSRRSSGRRASTSARSRP